MPRAVRADIRVRIAAAVVGAVVLLTGCAGTNAAQNGPGGSDNRFIGGNGAAQVIKVGDRKNSPSADGRTLEGKPAKLADLRGKVVVVNFWASWCAPCRGEAPTLEKLHTENKAKGVEFLGVDIKDSQDGAKAFERKFKVTYPSLYDKDGRITLAFREIPPNAVPSTLIIDRQGRVAVRIIGATTYSKLNPLLGQMAAEK